jgi:hypothetical protein
MSCYCIHGNKSPKITKYAALTLDKKKELITEMTGLSFNSTSIKNKVKTIRDDKEPSTNPIMPNHVKEVICIDTLPKLPKNIGKSVLEEQRRKRILKQYKGELNGIKYKGGYWICSDGMKYLEQKPAYIHELGLGRIQLIKNNKPVINKDKKQRPKPVPPTPPVPPVPPVPPEPPTPPVPPVPPTPPVPPEPKHYSSFRLDGLLDRNYRQQHMIQTYRWLVEPFLICF